MINRKFIILTIFKCAVSDLEYIHTIVQISSPSSSRTLSLSETETPYPLNTNSLSPLLPLWKAPFYLLSL